MQIGGFQKFSLIDYPDKIAAIVFTQGCNFRCPYCHNPELIGNKEGLLGEDEILSFLKTRQGKLDGVVITGGEPTLQRDLGEFCTAIKKLGFLIKLDTNGTNPQMLSFLIGHKLVDYIAMDIKTSLENYPQITRTQLDFQTIKQSVELIQQSGISHEFRTTVANELFKQGDFKGIAALVKDSKYYLQKFVPSKLLDASCSTMTSYSDQELEQIISKYFLAVHCSYR